MKLLLVVDVQYDFIYGALGSDYAQKILPDIQKYISDWREDNEDEGMVIFTQDSHTKAEWKEKKLVEAQLIPYHCGENETGSSILVPIASNEPICEKETFMVPDDSWEECEKQIAEKIAYDYMAHGGIVEDLHVNFNDTSFIEEIDIIGYCTDICVISNALLLRRNYPGTPINIIENLCAGTSKEAHDAALTVAKSCLINVRKSNE